MNSKKEFTLNKVKFPNNGGIHVEFQAESEGANGKSIGEYTFDCDDAVHPVLLEIRDRFREAVMFSANGLAPINIMLDKGNILLDQKLGKESVEDYKETVKKTALESIRVTGIHLYHTSNGIKVKVSGGFDSPLGYSALNTPQITFEECKHGFEEEMENDVEDLITEVFKYVVENKRAQLEMFNGDNGEGGEPAPKTDEETKAA